jgi:hypothetical protein
MKCPIRSGLLDSSESRRDAGMMSRATSTRLGRVAAASRAAMPMERADTRFLNPEAVFFVVL